MGIVGVGHDLVKVSRIAHVYGRFGERFLRRAYNQREIEDFRRLELKERSFSTSSSQTSTSSSDLHFSSSKAAEFLASRWAAKEAIYKVLSGQNKVPWIPFPDIIVAKGKGKPVVELVGKAKESCQELCGSGDLEKTSFAHLSLSHDGGFASSFFILESRP